MNINEGVGFGGLGSGGLGLRGKYHDTIKTRSLHPRKLIPPINASWTGALEGCVVALLRCGGAPEGILDVCELFGGAFFAVEGPVGGIDGVFAPGAGLHCAALDAVRGRLYGMVNTDLVVERGLNEGTRGGIQGGGNRGGVWGRGECRTTGRDLR